MRRALTAALLGALVVSAGCLGATGTLGTATAGLDDGAGDGGGDDADGGATGGTAGSPSSVDGPTGTVSFYVSDRPNDMDDFEHLNVTVTSVRFHLVDSANGTDAEAATPTATVANESTATTTPSTETATAAETVTVTETATATETAVETAAEETEAADDADEAERDGEGEDGRWVVRDVNATTVDLTRLRGDNATLVERFELPAGEYDQVRLEISEVDGTLQGGESTTVKLPSGRMKLNTEFAIGNGSETDFVYDISVHEAGKSGKYILKPVVGESGTDQPIERVGDDSERGDDRDDNRDERAENALNATFVGAVEPGENVTVRVTENGTAVANATVSVDGESVGTTDDSGEYVVAVPADAEELEVEIASGDAEAELEREFGGDEETAATDDGGDGGGDGGPGNGDEAGDGNGDGRGN